VIISSTRLLARSLLDGAAWRFLQSGFYFQSPSSSNVCDAPVRLLNLIAAPVSHGWHCKTSLSTPINQQLAL
jgi:hypothetical protein